MRYCRGLNPYQYSGSIFLLQLQYQMPKMYVNRILVIIQAPTVSRNPNQDDVDGRFHSGWMPQQALDTSPGMAPLDDYVRLAARRSRIDPKCAGLCLLEWLQELQSPLLQTQFGKLGMTDNHNGDGMIFPSSDKESKLKAAYADFSQLCEQHVSDTRHAMVPSEREGNV